MWRPSGTSWPPVASNFISRSLPLLSLWPTWFRCYIFLGYVNCKTFVVVNHIRTLPSFRRGNNNLTIPVLWEKTIAAFISWWSSNCSETEAPCSPETSVTDYQQTRRHILQDCCGNHIWRQQEAFVYLPAQLAATDVTIILAVAYKQWNSDITHCCLYGSVAVLNLLPQI
jgi:hypothetical protein